MNAEMASWKSTGTYVDEVPPLGANIVSGMWIFRVKRPSGSLPVFKARYVARGFSQRQGVDFFQTFSPTPKMTFKVLVHVAAQRDYELHSLDFSTAFLQGSLHEEIWLRRPPGFTGSFPAGTQWSLRRPVYGLRQAPCEWHDTLSTTLAALGFAPSTADPSLFLHTDATLPPFYVIVAQRTITLTQSHMVQQVLQRFGFTYSSPQSTPLPTGHSLSAPPSDESVEPSGPYPELVGCLMYLMTCTRPDLAYPLSLLACYVSPGRHRKVHWDAAKRVLRYLCSTLGMGLVLGGRARVVLTGHADASWVFLLASVQSLFAGSRGLGLWPFVVQYAAHQLNLQPQVSVPETSPTLRWTGKVGDASAFRVWGSRAFVRDLSADKLSPRAVPCVFLGFPPDAPRWQFYHPTSRRVLSSQDVTFDESVPFYRLFPYRTAPLPPPPLFLAQGPPPVDPLPPQGPAPSGVSQVDAVEPVEVAVDSGAAGGAEPGGAESGGAAPWGAESGGAASGGAELGGAEPGGAEPWGTEPGGAESARVASRSPSSRRELLSPQELREWFARRWSRATGAGGPPVSLGPGGARTGGTGAVGTGGAAAAAGVGPAGASGAAGAGAPRGVGAGVGATGASGAVGAGATGGVGAGVGPAGGTAGAAGGPGAAGPAGVGAVRAGGAAGTGAATGGTGAVPVGTGDPARPRPYFVPLLEQVLGLPPSPGPAPPLECSQPVQSQSQLLPVSPLPAPSPYVGPTGGLDERLEPASRPASPVRTPRTSRRAPRPRPPAVPGTHQMTLRPSTAPLRVPLPSPPASSLPVLADPVSDSLRAASPTAALLLSTVVTHPSFESTAASALVAELVDFAARCCLDYAASLVAESASVCPPSVGGECALSTDVLEDRQEEFQCFSAALPHLSAMDAEMASWKSTGTYVDDVPPPGANIVSGMCIFRVKRPPGSPPVFKAHYVARGFSQRQGVDYFQTFSSTPKMTTLRVLLHVAAQRDYELHSLDFSTAFLQGSLHEEIWLRRPPGFTGSFPPGTQWSLRRPVYGLRQAPLGVSTSALVFCSPIWRCFVSASVPTSTLGHCWRRADDQATQRSSQGYTFSLGSGSVSWRSTRSSSVLGSSCEAEIYARAMAAQELRWLTHLLADLGEPPRSPPVLYVNNKAMLALCREHRLEHRTKHIALRYFLARELQQRGQLRLAYVASEANTADIFTKALPPGDHQRFCTMLGLVPTWPHLFIS
ncbi:unnamed protein product [Closterium sp. NIES-54]